MKKTSIIHILICCTLLLGGCSQSGEEPAAHADSGGSQQKAAAQPRQTSLATASHQQPQWPKYRTVYRTINGQQMTLTEIALALPVQIEKQNQSPTFFYACNTSPVFATSRVKQM